MPLAATPGPPRSDSSLGRQRMESLDGLRGVAALVVVIFHTLSALAPAFVPEQQPNAHWVSYTPLAILWNGNFAVLVFFVLSGFVVTAATLRKSNPIWVDVTIRYLRLAVPATISVLIAKCLLELAPTAATALAGRTGSPWLGYIYQGDIPSLRAALFDGAVGIFTHGGSQFNNVLWTMKPELIGSLMCFGICLCPGPRTRMMAAALLAVAAIAVRKYEYEAFLVGIALHELWLANKLPTRWPAVAMFIGLLIGAFSGDAADRFGLGNLPEAFQFRHHGGVLYPIAAGLVVYGCIQWTWARLLFSGRWAVFLGAISFPLYLIHVPLIDTVVAAAIMTLPNDPAVYVPLGLSAVCLMIPLAYGFEMGVERPFLRALGHLRRALAGFDAHVRRAVRLRGATTG